MLNYRRSSTSVAHFVEQLHISKSYSLAEKLHYSVKPKDNPYPAIISNERLATITCGHNPWVEAKMVRNISLGRDVAGHELLEWRWL